MGECSSDDKPETTNKVFDEFKKKIVEAKFSPNMDKILLERYLKVSGNNLENAFALLKHGLELRQKAPYLFLNRDLRAKEIQTACTTFQFCPLKKLTKEKYKITIIRFPKCDASVYDTVDVIKTALMMFDAGYALYDNEDGIVEGEIFILDVEGFSFKQFLDVSKNAKTVLLYGKFLQEAAPVTLMCNHITNTSSVFDGIMSLVKPVMSKDVGEMIETHKSPGSTLGNFIDKDVLPIDYGGTNGTIDDHYKEWLKIFETKRDYLLNDKNWLMASDCA